MRKIKIAGPCSVESKAQMDSIANGLINSDITYLRGGVWKPRTRPGQFNGLGDIALMYLRDAGDKMQTKVCCEVAIKSHVEKAHNMGIDAFWIGARTASCPFAVEEITKAVKKTKKPLFIKNPICGSLALWSGAIERSLQKGIETIAIHRGRHAEYSMFRNAPMWGDALEIKNEFKIPVITDCSHIAGKRKYIQYLYSVSNSIAFDGEMIEVHNKPSIAVTDADQQITPEAYNNLSSEIDIIDIRFDIDYIDSYVIHFLDQRMTLSKLIGEKKKSEGAPIYQESREQYILDKISKNRVFYNNLKNVYQAILSESKRIQNESNK